MRKLLLASAVAAGLLILAACGGSGSSSSTTPTISSSDSTDIQAAYTLLETDERTAMTTILTNSDDANVQAAMAALSGASAAGLDASIVQAAYSDADSRDVPSGATAEEAAAYTALDEALYALKGADAALFAAFGTIIAGLDDDELAAISAVFSDAETMGYAGFNTAISSQLTTIIADVAAASDAESATSTFSSLETTIESVTPRVEFTAANGNLDEWSDWRDSSDDDPEDSMTQLAVFEKLLSDSAESVFAPAEFLVELTDTMAAVEEQAPAEWDTGGTVTGTAINPDTEQSMEFEITIIIPTAAITIPEYFQDKVEQSVQDAIVANVDRILEFDHGEWAITLAIGDDDDYYYAVATAVADGLGETQTFIGYMERATGTINLHYASASTVGIYTRWTGNPEEGWFKIAQVTDGSNGNQEVVGGGENMNGEGSIAFKARNNDDDTGDSTDVYYLADLSVANIEDDIDPGVAPTFGEPAAGTGSIEYIIEGNDKCLGWIGQNLSPASREEIAWTVE